MGSGPANPVRDLSSVRTSRKEALTNQQTELANMRYGKSNPSLVAVIWNARQQQVVGASHGLAPGRRGR